MTQAKTVHVVFKTHLDIGYTDRADTVLGNYINHYIPGAIALAERLEAEGGREQFIWTTGSWLIDHYLRTETRDNRERLERAIEKGHITWHGLPFTTHTEIMDDTLFDFGLSIAQRLDTRFGRERTIAAKMTDVPGHTKAIVPHMSRRGIRYLHIGVNNISPNPVVPPLFVWRAEDGSELIVHYSPEYGAVLEVEGFTDVLILNNRWDNDGIPSYESVKALYKELEERYPGADIRASTLDAFAGRVLALKERLPVVTEEIGDSWIYGIASDPLKISRYRQLLRLRDRWSSEGRIACDSESYRAFSNALLMVAEHTWGADTQVYLTDFVNYSKQDFHQARDKDVIDRIVLPASYDYLLKWGKSDKAAYSFVEGTWEEQRRYVQDAVDALAVDPDLQAEAVQALNELVPVNSLTAYPEHLAPYTMYEMGQFSVSFADDGSIQSLIDRSGKSWVSELGRLGEFTYQTFGPSDFQRWYDEYSPDWEHHRHWIVRCFGKAGFEYSEPGPRSRTYSPEVQSISVERGQHSDNVRILLRLPTYAVAYEGAPDSLSIQYCFNTIDSEIDVELSWYGKDIHRMPEASWFSFVPHVHNPSQWKINKLGRWISPVSVVKNGNRNMHGTQYGVMYEGADCRLEIASLDAAIVAVGERRLLEFDNTYPDLSGGIHFNLHNNVWGTNFRMWYGEDTKFRFRLLFESYNAN